MKINYFLSNKKLFCIHELKQFYEEVGGGRPINQSSLETLVSYHAKKGHIVRIRRGLYYVVPFTTTPEKLLIEPYLIAAKLSPDAVLGYQTAFSFFGFEHSIFSTFFYITATKVRSPFDFRGCRYIAVAPPKKLVKAGQVDFGVKTINYYGQDVRVTSLERAFVDVLDRPSHCADWEEVWRILERLDHSDIDVDMIIQYTKLLGNATTASKVGFFLEGHREELKVSETQLSELKKLCPQSPHYMDKKNKAVQHLNSTWNLIIPENILQKTWEEPNGDF